jgi:23S rRNA (guanosine2251-2'-O)-methyltransferase
MSRLNAKQLRDLPESESQNFKDKFVRKGIILILENIYDTYNVGGIFRLADALAVEKVYLCGQMETPPNPKIAKASIGTYKIVPWEYKNSVKEAILEIKSERPYTKIYAVEQSEGSDPYTSVSYTQPFALVVGNETFGVTDETLKEVDKVVEIPMWGINKSLNVIVSCAIVAYHAVSSKQ